MKKKYWSEDQLEYICKFHDIDCMSNAHDDIGRSEEECEKKINELKNNGDYFYYRNLEDGYYVRSHV